MVAQLKTCPLFAGIDEADYTDTLRCLSATERRYPKGSFIYHAGDPLGQVGVVLSGAVQVVQEDYWGRRTIVTQIQSGGLFAEAFACACAERLPVSVFCPEAATVLLISLDGMFGQCPFQGRLVQNMLRILAGKNLYLTEKMEVLSHRTIREKVLAYLSKEAVRQGSGRIKLGYTRQGLADYLNVDRSALSRELSAMQRDGLLRLEKSIIHLDSGAQSE